MKNILKNGPIFISFGTLLAAAIICFVGFFNNQNYELLIAGIVLVAVFMIFLIDLKIIKIKKRAKKKLA